ncbi:thioredoxin Trx2 [Schizosaccharomyces cryophilus OY26]|uniref:Thioredoxin Trx2 n=1 Tax=Schizosaccharomyces cryophilus (strain OY26 / ATCC MYA-4695 / CBS 11777 / NBRC 106824 / NRRL Y48691) TaxID=653667 RepID=S9XAQ0_SCHCR|nr:thioredoxin Trx2 [Schizosaccharomyces cryophilus OY26]EPY54232.1 thioredoxin Trx2 [Schizosaccharomyces cryophilus OY26]
MNSLCRVARGFRPMSFAKSGLLNRTFMSSSVLKEVQHVKSMQDYTRLVNDDKVSVVDFYADWCGPCKFLSPLLEKLSNSHSKSSFIAVDADKFSELAQKNEVYALPTVVLFKKGQELDRIVGADIRAINGLLAKYETS